jgi:hypothetical protein
MFAAILLLFTIPSLIDGRTAKKFVYAPFSHASKNAFVAFICIFMSLMFLGSRAAAAPYVGSSKFFTT